MIRASHLQIAEHCGLAPKLAIQYPETSAAADRGTDIHRQIAEGKPETPEARAALAYLAVIGGAAELERKVELLDPETGEVITAGTADVVIRHPDGALICLDWKTGRPDNVEPPDGNLQLWAYALAAMDDKTTNVSVALVFLDGSSVDARYSGLPAGEVWPMLDRIRRAASRPPVASPGAHCSGCWQRYVCASYRERASLALTLLPSQRELELSDEKAAALMLRVRQVREAADLAEEMVRAHVTAGGRVEADGKVYGPYQVAGRRSGPSVKELEAAGLGHLVKQGQPSTRWEWRTAK